MAIHVAQEFTADLGTGVGADGKQEVIVFSPRNIRIDAIHTRRRGKDELPDAPLPGNFQHVLRAGNVYLLVRHRVHDGRTHARFGRPSARSHRTCLSVLA